MVFAAALAACLPLLPACGAQEAGDAWSAFRAGVEAVRGGPSDAALRERERFFGAGIAFDYPAPLTMRHEASEGDDTWTFEHGLYTLELYVDDDAETAQAYLDGLGSLYGEDGATQLVAAAKPGRTLALCGRPVRSATMRVRLLGDESVYEAFDLPPAPDGRGRLLIVSDEPRGGRPSAVAAASERVVLGSLRCDDKTTPGATARHEKTP